MELYLAVYFFMVTYLFFGGWGERVEVFSVFDQIQEIFLRTWNSMEDFIQENWPGITTWDVNSLLSATINLTSAKANGVYFQLQEINLLHIIESNWSSLGGLCLNM